MGDGGSLNPLRVFFILMAVHKYMHNVEGGYWYRFYPKLTVWHEKASEGTQRELFEGPPMSPKEKKVRSFYGKFLKKYNDGYPVIEFEQAGEISIHDYYTHDTETRELVSILVICVPPEIYSYPFMDDKIYMITQTTVHELL